MKPQEWRQKLGDCVRYLFLSPEMKHFYSTPMTTARARIYVLQLGLYVRPAAQFWPQVAANCPEFEVKQRIMEHEYEELVEDETFKTRSSGSNFSSRQGSRSERGRCASGRAVADDQGGDLRLVLDCASASLAGGDCGFDYRRMDQ